MKINYNREDDVMLIELDASASIDHAEHVGSLIVHFDPQDKPILLEILNASEFLSGLVKATMRAEPVTV
ncbi:MAG: hypothetical protein KPEEDBHJ_01942 [Anaerolineales bacterium]|nr:hypothetical protein [Anaerolineales bacterium]